MVNKKVISFYVSILFLIITYLLSCEKKQSLPKPDFGDTLIISDFFEPEGINPFISESSIASTLSEIIFDSLVDKKNDKNFSPLLAQSWSKADNAKKWTFFLRKGIKFHDGVELTSEDVKFTYELLKKIKNPTKTNIGGVLKYIEDIDDIKILDTYTVYFQLKNPEEDFLDMARLGIVPKHILEKEKGDLEKSLFNYNPIGTGPYKLEKWSKKEIVLLANKSYFQGRPYLDKIVVKFYPNKEMAWAKVMSGEADIFYHVTPETYSIMETNSKIKLYSYLFQFSYMLAVNNESQLFKDQKVRQALNYIIDKNSIIKQILSGKGKPCVGTIYPQSEMYNKQLEPYPFNPLKGLELLAEAGWKDRNGDHFLDKNGKRFKFYIQVLKGDEMFEKLAILLQQQFLDVGIEINLDFLEPDMIYETVNLKKNYEAVLLPLTIDFDFEFFHTPKKGGNYNIFNYYNSKIDAVLGSIEAAKDNIAKKRLYKEFQSELKKDPPGVFLFWREIMIALDRRFEGVDIGPNGILKGVRNWYVPKEKQKYR